MPGTDSFRVVFSKIDDDIYEKETPAQVPSYLIEEISTLDDYDDADQQNENAELLENMKLNAMQKPFIIQWSFGFNANIDILNLTCLNRMEIFFASTNFGIFYNYKKREMNYLEGHKNIISSVSIDDKGKYLVTADKGKDCIILIWNSFTKKLVLSLFEPYKNGVHLIKISRDAKYLVSIGYNDEQNYVIDFWLWTTGTNTPNDTFIVKESYGRVKSIDFYHNLNELFVVIFENALLFFMWRDKLSEPNIVEIDPKISAGKITDGIFIRDSFKCAVCTVKGVVAVFGGELNNGPINHSEISFINAVKVTNVINCITSINQVIIIGDNKGLILFFDDNLKLLYWMDFSLPSISKISFEMDEKMIGYPLGSLPNIDRKTMYSNLFSNTTSDKRWSTDASLSKNEFKISNFFASTMDGNIYNIDVLQRSCRPLFSSASSPVMSIDTHHTFPYILAGYKHGKISLYNYETHLQVTSVNLNNYEDYEFTGYITYVAYSQFSVHLAVGTSTGQLWILETVSLKPRMKPFTCSSSGIVKIVFSPDCSQMAYYDLFMTVFLFQYEPKKQTWKLMGKLRGHYKNINDILFHNLPPHSLCTIGNDRYLVKYKIKKDKLDIGTRERIEQKDIPVHLICYKKNSKQNCLLLVDDKHKYKYLNEFTFMTTSVALGPSFGCFKNDPVCKMEILTGYDNEYLIFMNKTNIGIQKLPLDGNPYKFVASLGHPEKLLDFRISNNGKYIFTIGEKDSSILMWNIDVEAVQTMEHLGGTGIEPYYCLLEGGKNGWLFKEMQDLFYYIQIMEQGENIILPRLVGDYIGINELPYLVRACGYFPTVYETENLMIDVKCDDFENPSEVKEKISFTEFVQLFINHRPVKGYTKKNLEEAFTTLMKPDGAEEINSERDFFITSLCSLGEPLNTDSLQKVFDTLLKYDFITLNETDEEFDFLPELINFNYFYEEILGHYPEDLNSF